MSQTGKFSKRIFIIGAGFMGRGIAQICAQHGFSVSLIDNDKEVLADARKEILWSLEKLFSKKQMAEEPGDIIKRVVFSVNPDVHDKVDFLIECVPEDISLKKTVLVHYDKICPSETIFATNTSAIPIGKIAASTTRSDRLIGTHFASPPVMQKLVEVIPSLMTSKETVLNTRSFLENLERDIVEVKVDKAGFIMNRIYLASAAEGIRLLECGVASSAEIDRAMRVGFGWSKGPLEAADLAGLDIIRAAMISIWEDTADPRFSPPESLTRLVEAGRLGRKTGSGFYDYSKGDKTKKS
ncbi:MAG: 3-hydroxyacyl-CoA dehydrogenase family protein [Desulfobacteraceae bacterium]|nr:3-hydroxyacyl-CoA dehydrogenase family protein [Desulfobacteraceae bacterium]